MGKPKRLGTKVPVLSAADAVSYIEDGSTVAFAGAGGGIGEATACILALRDRFVETGAPKSLTLWHATGLGDRGDKGMSPLALPGLVKRVYGGHWAQSPRLATMAEKNEIEAYNFPQGVMSQLIRTTAAGQPGLLSKVGVGTFIDPRLQGAKMNTKTTEELIQVHKINGTEYLYYPAIPLDVCFIRGTTSDTEGYISMEDEISFLDTLAMATAVHNNGGLVIAQVKRLVKGGTLHPKSVKIPGYLVDALVVVPEQEQLYNGSDRFFSGDYVYEEQTAPIPLNQRKAVARRALLEVRPGNVGNVGVGIADGIGLIAREEGVGDEFTLTVETGPIGGATAQGIFFGASINSRALIDMPAQFDFYGGGGLDVAYLSFAEADQYGNVNVHYFNNKLVGTGGFVDICAGSKKIVFCGTLRAGGLKTTVGKGKLTIDTEGKFQKFLPKLEYITFSGPEALRQGKEVVFITERAVFELRQEGLVLTEAAPGLDIEKDVIQQMGFTPVVAKNVKTMDSRIFTDAVMGIRDEFLSQ